jgi:16S rRNA (guanine1207-N2)-methyltransferase
MADHYYTKQPHAAHHVNEWTFELKNRVFRFATDSGVFSKGTVDFGSRVLIDTFSTENLPEGTVLDIGCGYGPIGLALAYATNRKVEMVDINERAVHLAQQNAALNQLTNVTIHSSNLYEEVLEKNYAAIVSNPPIRAGKKVVHAILAGAYERLLPKGTLTIVIQKKQGAPSAQKKMVEVFGNAEIVAKEKGYYVIKSVKEKE